MGIKVKARQTKLTVFCLLSLRISSLLVAILL